MAILGIKLTSAVRLHVLCVNRQLYETAAALPAGLSLAVSEPVSCWYEGKAVHVVTICGGDYDGYSLRVPDVEAELPLETGDWEPPRQLEEQKV